MQLFLRLRTQWRVGMRGPIGLDYAGVRAALAMMRVRATPSLFEDLQTMEAAALSAMVKHDA